MATAFESTLHKLAPSSGRPRVSSLSAKGSCLGWGTQEHRGGLQASKLPGPGNIRSSRSGQHADDQNSGETEILPKAATYYIQSISPDHGLTWPKLGRSRSKSFLRGFDLVNMRGSLPRLWLWACKPFTQL